MSIYTRVILCAGLVSVLAAIGLAFFIQTSAVSAQDATRMDLPEVAIPLVKCQGTDACFNVDLSKVADGACNGDYACYHLTPYTGTIGAGSCNFDHACYHFAPYTGTIGAGSCNGAAACDDAAGSIGNNSCNDTYACQVSAGSIGAGSCTGESACESAAGSIGNNSCNGTYACYYVGDSIGAGSCNGDSACVFTGGSIGAGSCNGASACFHDSPYIVTIGSGSCNGYEACLGATSPIGDCESNNVTPAACLITPTNTSTATPTPTAIATNTATPTATNTPTKTPIPPMATPTSTPTPLPPATVSGIVRLQGRSSPGMAGTVTLADTAGTFGVVSGGFDAGTGEFSLAVPALAGGSTYTLTASHSLYLSAEKILTVFPGGAYAQAAVTLRGGDAENSGAVGIGDLTCIGAAFNRPPFACLSGTSDLNGDNVVNIFDLVIAGTNYGLTSPQPWP